MKLLFKALSLLFCFVILFSAVGCELKNRVYLSDLNGVGAWVGGYEFCEHADPDITLDYNMTIYKNNGKYYANLTVEGFQSSTDVVALVKGDKDKISLIFEKYRKKNTFQSKSFNQGDVLLCLQRKNEKIYTSWVKVKSDFPANQKLGKVYFVKVVPSRYSGVTITGQEGAQAVKDAIGNHVGEREFEIDDSETVNGIDYFVVHVYHLNMVNGFVQVETDGWYYVDKCTKEVYEAADLPGMLGGE